MASSGLMHFCILILISCCFQIFGNVVASQSGKKSHEHSRREENLDHNNKYTLIWAKDFETQKITFEVIVKTLGFVGFGISPSGGMTGADIVVGGVHPNGRTYFSDYHAVGTQLPDLDDSQDWKLLEGSENGTHTTLKFSRKFDTCDENDIKITNDTRFLIWSFGATDELSYHMTNRGSYSAILLDPPMPVLPQGSDVKTWRLAATAEMSEDKTTYWCRVYKSPPETTKQHVIGFEAHLPSKDAVAHTHHMIVRSCEAPEGVNLKDALEYLVDGPGYHCYKSNPNLTLVNSYCHSYLFAWGVGGRRAVFPEHVGLPLAGGKEPDYFVMEIHYNNFHQRKGVTFETGVNIFHTSKLRKYDAGLMIIGHDVSYTQVLPPKTKEFINVGHCSSECTNDVLPPDGIKVFTLLLHTHRTGRALKIRHFRDGKELPWLVHDAHYNSDFQQNRPLKDEIKLLPKDQFTLECTYDTSAVENVTIGGFGSREEMCQTFLLYYPKIDLQICGSRYPRDMILDYFGIEDASSQPGETDAIIKAPADLQGKLCSEVFNNATWTPAMAKELQKKLRYENHKLICFTYPKSKNPIVKGLVAYPNVTEFLPPNSCKHKTKKTSKGHEGLDDEPFHSD